jgi:hypothetical protein
MTSRACVLNPPAEGRGADRKLRRELLASGVEAFAARPPGVLGDCARTGGLVGDETTATRSEPGTSNT